MKIQKLILSCFGIGFIPFMPGTFGSLLMLGAFLTAQHFSPVHTATVLGLTGAIIVSSVLCVVFAGRYERLSGKKDPGWIVLDEFAGQAVALFPAAVTSGEVLPPAIAAFVLFRVFDIWKPSPIREMEQLDGGWGILADDLVAGVIAGTVVCIITYLARFLLQGGFAS